MAVSPPEWWRVVFDWLSVGGLVFIWMVACNLRYVCITRKPQPSTLKPEDVSHRYVCTHQDTYVHITLRCHYLITTHTHTHTCSVHITTHSHHHNTHTHMQRTHHTEIPPSHDNTHTCRHRDRYHLRVPAHVAPWVRRHRRSGPVPGGNYVCARERMCVEKYVV
jgi:hypothetical protein